MRVWQRIHRIIRASLTAPPEQPGSCEADIDALVRDMEEAVLELRRNTAAAISSRNATRRRIQRATEEEKRQQGDAEPAVQDGDDGPAGADSRLEPLQTRMREEQDLAQRLEDELRQAEGKLREIRAKCDALTAKRTRLATREGLARSTERPGGAEAGSDALARLEESVQRQQDEVEAWEQLASGPRAAGTDTGPRTTEESVE